MHIQSILTPARTLCGAPGNSKKRVLENITQFICEDKPSLNARELFDRLIERERLGSTGLGNGIAIPHCRISNCRHVTGCLVTLEQPIDFDAIDGENVDLLFVLIVPQEAQEEHLNVLATLAQLFNMPEYCQSLRSAKDNQALYQAAIAAE